MSTQINQYLIYGTKLDYETYIEDERLDKFEDSAFNNEKNPNGLLCLRGGMDGEYIYLGRCLQKSANHEYLETTEINPIDPELAELTRLLIKAELGIDADMKLYFVTHYT